MIRTLIAGLFAVAVVAGPADAQEGAEEKSPLLDFSGRATEAAPEAVEGFLEEYDEAVKSGLGQPLLDVLAKMIDHSNAEFEEPAIDVLRKFRLGREDQKRIQDEALAAGERDRDDIRQLMDDFEVRVLCHAVRVAANHDSKKVKNAFRRGYLHKATRKERPVLAATYLLGLGRLGDDYPKIIDEAKSDFRKMADPIMIKAAIRYFGWIKVKDKSVVRSLCEQLSGPAPSNPNSPSNPPAAYWKARWEQWELFREDVCWALEQITGQEWKYQYQTGDDPGDREEALAYIDEHERELGLR